MSRWFTLPYCSDCGEARVPHALYKFQSRAEHLMEYVEIFFNKLGEKSYPRFIHLNLDHYVIIFFEWLAKMGLATLVFDTDPRDSIRTKSLFEGARTAGVDLRQFRIFNIGDNGTFIARKGGKELLFAVMPRPRNFVSPSLAWMDDKGLLKTFLMPRGIPTADGGVATTEAEALTIFDRIGPPVITKPYRTSRGIHTTLNIETRDGLRTAFHIAKQVTPYVIVEKELQGIVYRVTLIGGKVSGVVKRDYPLVLGDGQSTVRELLDVENENPLRDNFAFFKIAPNDRAEVQLKRQRLTWDSIPKINEHVILNDKVSRRHGTVTIDETDETHPENNALFEKIAHELGDPLIGVDFMIGDMSRSWKEQPGSGLIECNAMPYIDLHHYPYKGKPRDVAKDLWDYVFSYHS